jgi:hypothetical protein
VSVDTNVKGKNLAAYRKLRHDQFRILITPQLIGMAESMQIVAGGPLRRKLRVEFQPVAGPVGDNCVEVC